MVIIQHVNFGMSRLDLFGLQLVICIHIVIPRHPSVVHFRIMAKRTHEDCVSEFIFLEEARVAAGRIHEEKRLKLDNDSAECAELNERYERIYESLDKQKETLKGTKARAEEQLTRDKVTALLAEKAFVVKEITTQSQHNAITAAIESEETAENSYMYTIELDNGDTIRYGFGRKVDHYRVPTAMHFTSKDGSVKGFLSKAGTFRDYTMECDTVTDIKYANVYTQFRRKVAAHMGMDEDRLFNMFRNIHRELDKQCKWRELYAVNPPEMTYYLTFVSKMYDPICRRETTQTTWL